MNILAEQITKEFAIFATGVRVMMLINRGVNNSNKGSRRWLNKLISTNEEEFKSNFIKLMNQKSHLNNDDNRIYVSINPRKLDNAIKYFMHKQIDLNTQEEINLFYKNIQSSFCSALMKPENRDGNLFIIDYDTDDYTDDYTDLFFILGQLNISIIKYYETPNGWHIITEPFNPALLSNIASCEVKKDALALLMA